MLQKGQSLIGLASVGRIFFGLILILMELLYLQRT